MLLTRQQQAAVSQSSWTPSDLGALLIAWWDAERADKLTLSGSQVTTWTDLVAGYAPTQAVGGSKPIYQTTGLNGRPAVFFDGIDDVLTLAATPAAFPAAAVGCELWILGASNTPGSSSAGTRPLGYGVSSATGRSLRRVQAAGTVSRGAALCGNGASVVQATDAGRVFDGIHVLRGLFQPTLVDAGVDQISGFSLTPVVPATVVGTTRIGSSVASAEFWSGTINSALVTKPLTDDQASALMLFLKRRGSI